MARASKGFGGRWSQAVALECAVKGLGGGGRKPLRLSARSCDLRPFMSDNARPPALFRQVQKITFLPLGTLR